MRVSLTKKEIREVIVGLDTEMLFLEGNSEYERSAKEKAADAKRMDLLQVLRWRIYDQAVAHYKEF